MKTAKTFTRFASCVTFLALTFAVLSGAHAQSKGMTFQGYLKDSGGNLVNASVSVTSQLLSPNDCVLMEETHSAVAITQGFFTVVIGKGTRTGADKHLAMRDVFNNGATRSGFDDASGATGSCNYVPTAGDARKVKLKFAVGSDQIAADFNVRANGFAFWSEDADNAQKLGGVAPAGYLQVNSGTGLTQSSLESLVTSLSGGIPGSSITSLPWSKLTSIPAPLATIGGLSCVNGQILQVSGGNWACAAAPSGGGSGTVTGVTSANAYLGITNGSVAPVLTVNVGTAANTVAAGNDSRFGNAQKIQNVNVDATAPTSGQVLKYDGTKWAPGADATGGGGGGLSGVTSTNAYITVANGTTAPDLTLNVGTAANTVAAGDDSRFGNATKIQAVSVDTTGLASGKILKYDGSKWAIADDDSGGAPSGSATGDLANSYPNPMVVAIRGNAVAATTPLDDQVYKYGSGTWSPVYVGAADLKKSTGTSQIPGTQCAANEKLDWVSGTDSFSCVAIGSLDASKITSGTLATAQLPTIPLNKGGTGETTAAAAFDALSPLTTKGDLIVRNATTNTRLAVGADGKFLRSDSAQATGLTWADVVATDLSSMVSTGIVQRNASNSYSSVTVNAPLTYSAGALGMGVGTGLSVTGGNLVVDTGTSSGQIPVLDGSGKLSSSVIPSSATTSPGGSNTQIQYNGSGSFAGSNLLTFDSAVPAVAVGNTAGSNYTKTSHQSFKIFDGSDTTDYSNNYITTTRTSMNIMVAASSATLDAGGFVVSNPSATGVTIKNSWQTAGPGQDLTLAAGAGKVMTADKNGGNLILSSGSPTGNGTSSILFQTATGTNPGTSTWATPATRMVIDAAGNVGVGITSPVVPLDVSGTARVLASVEGAAAAVSSSTAYSVPDLTRNVRRITLSANTTITLPNAATLPTDAAYSLTIRVQQDATGSRTLAWAGNVQTIKWDTGSAPAVATAANTETIYQFFIIGGESVWYGSMVWKEN